MFRHYLKTIFRHCSRHKSYTVINLLGLSLAVTCCLILLSYVRGELTYDQHNVHHKQIYRVANEITTSGTTTRFALTSQALGPLFVQEYPEVGEYVRFRNLVIRRNVFRHEDIERTWDDVRFADENVFDLFTHEAVYGQLEGALADPSSIVVSETFARSYFGSENPVGETVSTDTFTYRITAVFKDLPENSHLKYSALLSMNRLGVFGINDRNVSPQQLFNVTAYTYFLISPELGGAGLQRHLNAFAKSNTRDVGNQLNSSLTYLVQPLTDVHFDRGFAYDQDTGNPFYVYAFIAVSIFLVLVACINYTNLATARASIRGKEIGIRKVVGASQLQLIMQFLGEAIAYSAVAMIVGVLLVPVLEALTPLDELLGRERLLDLTREPELLAWIAGGAVLVGLLAGAYPALYLSSIPVVSALSANRVTGNTRINLRNGLVFLQLLVSIAVIACTLLMGLQMRYVASKPLGFERENRLAVLLRGTEVLEKTPVIQNELMQNPNVLSVSRTTYVPGDEVFVNIIEVESNSGRMEPATLNQILVGEEFIKVMGIEVLEGRGFSTRLLTDVGTSVVVNEALVQQMGWHTPIGKRIRVGDGGRVIGVVKDFHFDSLHEQVGPALLRPLPLDQLTNVSGLASNLVSLQIVISISGEDVLDTIGYVEDVISKFDPTHPFEFQFLDDLLNDIYASEVRLVKLTGLFAGICIFISCLGLFGLAAFATAQRTKEIGIRRVLGASTLQIVVMLSKTLMVIVLLAALLASILSFVVMREWYTGFAYRTQIDPWVFVTSSAAVGLLGFITVALQSIRTAQSNPADALRYE